MNRSQGADGVHRRGTPIERVLESLDRFGCHYRQSGGGWQAECPAHEDHSPSLSVREGSDGRALLHCFAGCEIAAVLQALGLTFSDLFPTSSRTGGGRRGRGYPR